MSKYLTIALCVVSCIACAGVYVPQGAKLAPSTSRITYPFVFNAEGIPYKFAQQRSSLCLLADMQKAQRYLVVVVDDTGKEIPYLISTNGKDGYVSLFLYGAEYRKYPITPKQLIPETLLVPLAITINKRGDFEIKTRDGVNLCQIAYTGSPKRHIAKIVFAGQGLYPAWDTLENVGK